MSPYEVYIVGEHLLFTLLMVLLLIGSVTVVSLVMFWAPRWPLFKGYDDPPHDLQSEPRDAARKTV